MLGSRSALAQSFACALACSFGVHAQQVLVVDAGALPGTAFVSIPDAISAANPGDTIVVRDGNHDPFVLSKGVTILADPFVFMLGGFEVSGVPAGEVAVLRGLKPMLAHPSVDRGVSLRNNLGAVYLEDIDTTAGLGIILGAVIDNCALVGLARCTFSGGPAALVVDSSTVHMTKCHINPSASLTRSPGMTVTASHVVLTETRVSGGFAAGLLVTAGDGLRLDSGFVHVGRGSMISGGLDNFGTPSNAVDTVAGQLALDPRAQLFPQNGGAPVAGPVIPTTQRLAVVATTGANQGRSMRIETRVEFGLSFATFLQVPAQRTPTIFGDLWGAGPYSTIATSNHIGGAALTFVVPTALPLGMHFGVQAVTLDPSTGALEFSAPTTTVVGR